MFSIRSLLILLFWCAALFGVYADDAADKGVAKLGEKIMKGLARAQMSDAGHWANARRRAANQNGTASGGGSRTRGQLLKDGIHFMITGTPDSNQLTGLALQALTTLNLQNYTISVFVHDSPGPSTENPMSADHKKIVQRYAYIVNRLHALPPNAVLVATTNEVFALPNQKGFHALVRGLKGRPHRAEGDDSEQPDVICLPPLPEDGVTHPGCDTGFLIARNTPRVVRLMGAVLANLQQMRKDVGGGGDAPTGLADSAVFNKAVNKTATKVQVVDHHAIWTSAAGCPAFDRHVSPRVALLTLQGPCPAKLEDKVLQATRTINGYLKTQHRTQSGSSKEEISRVGLVEAEGETGEAQRGHTEDSLEADE